MRVYKNTANFYGIEKELDPETGSWFNVQHDDGEVFLFGSEITLNPEQARKVAAKIIEMAERAEKFNAKAGRK